MGGSALVFASMLSVVDKVSLSDLLKKRFDSSTLARGRSYFASGAVEQVHFDKASGTISAEVSGTSFDPYEVHVTLLDKASGELKINGTCTCPVGKNCKHAAATVLTFEKRFPNGVRSLLEGAFDFEFEEAPSKSGPDLSAFFDAPVFDWISELETKLEKKQPRPDPAPLTAMFTLSVRSGKSGGCFIKVRVHPHGGKVDERLYPFSLSRHNFLIPKELDPELTQLITRIGFSLGGDSYSRDSRELVGPNAPNILEEIVRTGRCFVDGFLRL